MRTSAISGITLKLRPLTAECAPARSCYFTFWGTSVKERLLNAYFHILLDRPHTVIAVLVALFVGLGFQARNFKLDASMDTLVLEHDDDVKYYRHFSERYADRPFVAVMLKPTNELFTRETLTRIKSLRDELAALERVESVVSMLDVPLFRNPPVPPSQAVANIKNLLDDGVDMDMAREEFASSPIFRDMLINADKDSTGMQVIFKEDPGYVALSKRRLLLREKRREGTITDAEVAELAEVQVTYSGQKDLLSKQQHDDVAQVRAILADYRDIGEIYLGGVPMVSDDMVSFIRNDLKIFGFGMALFLIATLWTIFRKKRWIVLPMLTCGLSVLVMMGLLGMLDWRVTVISSNFISLQLIMTMSLAIHLIVRYRELVKKRPEMEQRELVKEAVRSKFVPCLYTTLTTIAGFCSLLFCDILPVINFGWMMTLGLVVSLAITFLLFPAAMMLVDRDVDGRAGETGLLPPIFSRITDNNGNAVMAGAGIIALVTAIGINRLDVENSFINYFKESTEIYRGMTFIDQQLGGTTPLEVVISFDEIGQTAEATSGPADEPAANSADSDFDEFGEEPDFTEADSDFDEFAEEPDFAEESDSDFDEFADDPDFAEFEPEEKAEDDAHLYWYTKTRMDTVTRVHDYLDSLEATGKVLSLATTVKLATILNDGKELDGISLALLFKKFPAEFQDIVVTPYVSFEDNQARINLRIIDSLPQLRRDDLVRQIRRDLVEKCGLEEGQARLTGLVVLYNNMLQSLFRSQISTIGITVAALMIMFMLLFRSALVSFIAIFPNVLASITVLGLMGLLGIPLDMMTITIVAICIGIAVDNTIHYIHRFKRELAVDGDYVEAMHRSHFSIGNAMSYTSITIIVGFSILALSNFIPSVLFGTLTGVAMAMALVASLTLLPKLILLLKPFGKPGISD
jgi:predicted RND superfamily exporter protein